MFESLRLTARTDYSERGGMGSPTQRDLSADHIGRLVSAALGVDVADAAALAGGGFAAVWRARLADGRDVVVKVGPAPTVPLLEYESGMITAEAEYLRLVCGAAPVAKLLYHGIEPAVLDSKFVVTTLLPGTPLTDLPEAVDPTEVRRDLGAAVARIHRITGERFGYSGDRPHGATWPDAFAAMMESLLRDAAAWGVEAGGVQAGGVQAGGVGAGGVQAGGVQAGGVGAGGVGAGGVDVPVDRIRAALTGHVAALSAVREPALIHFDLWDGNVLATVDVSGVARLTGLVDGERYFFGDPLFDFVSPLLQGRLDEQLEHPFIDGYANALGAPVVFDRPSRQRLGLYRTFMYVLLLVEMPSRGMTGPDDEPRRRWAADLLDRQLADLGV